MKFRTVFVFMAFIAMSYLSIAEESKNDSTLYKPSAYMGLKLRLVGPALTSGRISHLAVNPERNAEFYVGVASGGVWKTTNGGVTFKPIFDGQNSYSIGCITLDPNNSNIVWVGTGENNSQRSVSYGDGVYKSLDGGKTWKNMGLKESKHIGKIIIDPRNSNVVYVAAFGPLWGPGGDRGLYKSTDGGETWEKSLYISENTGVSDIVIDPENPDALYASSYQRRRRVWTLLHGGPEAAIYKTTDAGKNWKKLKNGLPSGDLGRIGLAISPVNPDYVFALIESEKSGFYRSTDRGASWQRMCSYASSSAQYYQEIFCDPCDIDKIYSLETITKVSVDGGKTFKPLGNKHRHVDDHALWIDPNNTDHLLIGGDGGLYETYDRKLWRHFNNLPVTQFYRVSCDNSKPFYYVYGGTQDNNTWGCPSRTTNSGGITNEDWFQLVGGDGYQSRSDPENPDIVYCQWQYGNLMRYDRKSGELTYIQPQPEKGEEHRWNWDSPLIISSHKNTRLYFACNRVYKTEDKGNSWEAISPDLTRRIDRNELKIMGKVWSPEAISKNASTSFYGNIVALSESPINENLLYAGTDDGLIQVTEDSGKNWRKTAKFSFVPETTYVSDVFASQHNENVVYATFNNHKSNDYKPYVFKSEDKGETWTSIIGNLPENEPVWTIYEDFENPDLLFVGTEFGLYFTLNGGEHWTELKSGLPTIAVRDLEIQKEESDLVVGTFGRGIYILDDYSPLRKFSEKIADKEFHLFQIADALVYHKSSSRAKTATGEDFYRAKNPYGAYFYYYLEENIKTKKQLRKEEEKEIRKDEAKKYEYPTFEELRREDLEQPPYLIFEITDENGKIVRRLTTSPKKGIHKLNWDLRFASKSPVSPKTKTMKHSDFPVPPGKYYVSVYKNKNGVITKLVGPEGFSVNLLENHTLPTNDFDALTKFQNKIANLMQAMLGAEKKIKETEERIDLVKIALQNAPQISQSKLQKVRNIELELEEVKKELLGDKSKSKRNKNQSPSLTGRLRAIIYSTAWSYSEPTQTAKETYTIISEEFVPLLDKMRKLINIDLDNIEKQMQKANAPWTPGRIPYWKPEAE